ncbi:MAG: signal recognition particle protein [Thermoplasmata archaeon]|nr:MAG: signal recognition particle protein [Thermoplasmata archaeon]
MVLENLRDSLRGTVRKIASAITIDSRLIKDVVRDIQRSLLQADVNVKLVLELSKNIERRALQEKPPAGMSPREHVIRILYEELVRILGTGRDLPIKKQIILMVGLYGQGKTTTCGKLARYFKKKGLRPVLIAGDTHRPAAYDQLKQIAEKAEVPFYGDKESEDAVDVVRRGIENFRRSADVIIVDTAGRHKLEDDLIDEIRRMERAIKADEKILIIDSTIGQQARDQAKAFHEAVGITGIILTKMDGTAKGGGALSAAAEVGAPILFIGTGEHLEDLERFDPKSFVSRLLGMGDVKSLLEKAEEAIREKRAEEAIERIASGRFTLKDMYQQIEMMKGMGPLHKLSELLPFGFAGKIKDADMLKTQEKLNKFRYIMDSMTEEELEHPEIIKGTRIKRIARGAGVDSKDVKELLRYYHMTKSMMKGISSNRKLRRSLMRQLKFT